MIEIRPPVSWDKGRAMHYILDRLRSSETEPLWWETTRPTSRPSPRLLGRSRFASVTSAARYRLEDPAAVAGTLAWLEGVEPHDAGPAIGGTMSSSRGGE